MPLWPALTVLLGVAITRWKPVHRAAAILLVVPAFFTQLEDPSWPRRVDAESARAEATAVRDALAEAGVEAAWTDYWDTYRLALLVDGDIPWAPTRMLDRRPDWTEAAMAAGPVAYLIRPGDTETLDLLESQPLTSPSKVMSSSEVAGFRLIVTGASVPTARGAQGRPSTVRFTAASVSPLLLFAGALLVVGLGTRLLFPEPYQRTTHQPGA